MTDARNDPLLVCVMANGSQQGCSTIAGLAASAGSPGLGPIVFGSVGQDPPAKRRKGAVQIVIPMETARSEAVGIVDAFEGRHCFLDIASGTMCSDAPVAETVRAIMAEAKVRGYRVIALLPARSDNPQAIHVAVDLGQGLPEAEKFVVINNIADAVFPAPPSSPYPCIELAFLAPGFFELAWTCDYWFFLQSGIERDVAELILVAWMRKFTNQLADHGLFINVNKFLAPIDDFDVDGFNHRTATRIEDTTNKALRRTTYA